MQSTLSVFPSDKDFYLEYFQFIRVLQSGVSSGDDLARQWSELNERKNASGGLLLSMLSDRLGLSGFEEFTVMLAFASAMDRKISCKNDQPEPDFSMAADLYGLLYPELDRFSLHFSSEFRRLMAEETTVLHGHLRLSKAALQILCGYMPDVAGCSCKIYESLPPLSTGTDSLKRLSVYLKHAAAGAPIVIRLTGDKGGGKVFHLQKLSEKSCIPLMIINASHLPQDKNELAEALNALFLSLTVAPAMVCLREYDDLPHTRQAALELQESTPYFCATVTGDSQLPDFGPEALALTHTIPSLSRTERKLIWEQAFRQENLDISFDLRPISNQYKLTIGAILDSAHSLRRRVDMGLACDEQALREIVETKVHKCVKKGLAKLIKPQFGWDDIILPNALRERLHEICARVKNADLVMEKWGFERKYPYGNGMSILFYGSPGTGKTMAAHIIAKELQTPLYYVDFSNMIDKYIGETEKHILELFRQARQAGAILFFDEADALFARRSEVSDATDRYANAQTACLLQSIEEYDGVVILATNLLSNFDEAFKRRMRYFLHFYHPDEPARREIWRGAIPKEAPLARDVDVCKLAKLELSAGTIKNIALTAAYLAAEDGEIGLCHLNRALRSELEKDGHAGDCLEGFE